MKPTTFTALNVSNLNNGTTTFAVTVQFDPSPALPRVIGTIGGGTYDTRGTRTSIYQPIQRRVTYLFSTTTNALLRAHINTLETSDKGKKGTLTYSGGDGFNYSCTAVLERVEASYLFDNEQQTSATITLVVQELTPLAKVI